MLQRLGHVAFAWFNRGEHAVRRRDAGPRERGQQLFVFGFFAQFRFDPFGLFFERLRRFARAAGAAEEFAQVEPADDEEEAEAHQDGEGRVDDFDGDLPPSADIENHPSLAAA
ncbi:MAG TPA: hypothetical protein VFK14_12900 [Solirubrobacterales bacterium]|nr:hypothetical protein [Solirubrobacterales bacterium]